MGKNEYDVPLSRYLLAFLMATALFILVFLAAYGVSYLAYQSSVKEQNIIQQYIKDIDYFLAEQRCNASLLADASDRLDRVGGRLSLLETRFGKQDNRVLQQKQLYTGLEFRHLSLVEQFRTKCNMPFLPLIFFYSNLEEDKELSERIGFVLSTFKRISPGNIMVYSYDYHLENALIQEMKAKYNLSYAPIVVVDGHLADVRKIDDLLPYLGVYGLQSNKQ